jgi:SAM-dependent methyltransferase
MLFSSVDDLRGYFSCDLESVISAAESWPSLEEKYFDPSRPDDIYAHDSETVFPNACANVINQLLDRYNVDAISQRLKPGIDGNVVLDYGCGTGALSINLLKAGMIKPSKLILSDVPSETTDYVRWCIRKHSLNAEFVEFGDLHEQVDVLLCIDVLEHLMRPSELLINKIHPLLRINGLLYLRAPWRGQLTHIDDAPVDFYGRGGGRRFLGKKYKIEKRLSGMEIGHIYRKVSA